MGHLIDSHDDQRLGLESRGSLQHSATSTSVTPRCARRNRTGLELFTEIRTGNERLVDQTIASWNRIVPWLGRLARLQALY